MAGGAALNAVTFIDSNYLARALSGDDPSSAQKEKVRHDKALEAYQAESNFSIGSQQMIG